MSGIVVDASVSLAWFFEDETTPFSENALDRLQTEMAWVPALWTLECGNALLSAQRRGRLKSGQKQLIIERAMALPLLIDREPVSLGAIDWLAEQYGLTTYDAAYLELAIRRSLTLLSLDAKLVAAAKAANHPVETGLI